MPNPEVAEGAETNKSLDNVPDLIEAGIGALLKVAGKLLKV